MNFAALPTIREARGSARGASHPGRGDTPCDCGDAIGNGLDSVRGSSRSRRPGTPSHNPPLVLEMRCDTREPWPHPWAAHWPAETVLEQATLETGDFCLHGAEDGAVVERKTAGDFLACLGGERERFERELARGRYAGRFCVVIEADLPGLLALAGEGGALWRLPGVPGAKPRRGFTSQSILGSLAAWTRRYGTPFIFAGNEALAAQFTWRFLTQPVREAVELTRPLKPRGLRRSSRQALTES